MNKFYKVCKHFHLVEARSKAQQPLVSQTLVNFTCFRVKSKFKYQHMYFLERPTRHTNNRVVTKSRDIA